MANPSAFAESIVECIRLATAPLHARILKLEGKEPGAATPSELREQVNAIDRRLGDLEQAATAPAPTREP